MLRGYHRLEKLEIAADEQQVKQLERMDANIYGPLRSAFVYVTSEKIFFLTEEQLPPGKLIVLSATIDPALYRLYYPGRRVDAFECRQAKYKGHIIQYTDSSYSRYAFQHYPDLLAKVKRFAADDTVITFQEIEKEFHTKYHFGNVEGLNLLNGKNLSVGTSHPPSAR